jgi:pyridoxamine 5'-phosphate oxidase family protein
MSFTEEEVAYLRSQRLARIATVAPDGQPDVVPVGFELDGDTIYIGGYSPANSRRHRSVKAGNHKVALVVDDFVSEQPWTPRFLRIYGTAEVVQRDGYSGSGEYLRITPTVSWSWNLEGKPYADGFGQIPLRRTVHQPPRKSA